MTTNITLYGIPNCDTVKKARRWLQLRGVEHRFVDFKKQAPSAAQLEHWAAGVGWERLLNRQGSTWRGLDDQVREGVTDASSACNVMLAHPSTIKRPVVEIGGRLIVGFDEHAFEDLLALRSGSA
jgi:Spx/MgsR family transcriptional regulator